ncbi:MAG: family 1 glycosylhydrolase [Actinomycetales bacterium]|nr:family 1 glycosylhydrolase [Actinomycetales bacterium]
MALQLPDGFRWPSGFLWGAATAAAQIEGAAHEDGKTDSIWDAFARVPGAVAGGDTPEVAIDHYHRMPEDLALLTELGLDAYRFSVSWSRVRPDDAAPNPAGLDFYSRMVDELLARGVRPFLTLYHWDLPQAVEERGGWTLRETAERFAEYAMLVHDRLGDRVEDWTTLNEPFCSTYIAYAGGEHAPGRTEPAAALAALHHQLLGHGLATRALREAGAARIGISLNLTNAVPADPDDPADLDAARRIDALWNRGFLEPVLRGAYPEDFLADVRGLGLEEVLHEGDLATIAAPIDFLGVNHYHDDQVSGRPLPAGTPASRRPTDRPGRSPFVGSEHVTFPPRDLPRTAMDWEVHPEGLKHLLTRLTGDYPELPPMYITENGSAYLDEPDEHGVVHDAERIAYLERHLEAVAGALADGADVRGYFAWTLLDNFEWAWGYAERFGLVRVDPETLERTVKDSGRHFAAIAAAARL